MWCFHGFCSFLGRNPPVLLVWCVRVERGGAAHVLWMVVVICWVSSSNFLQVSNHSSAVRGVSICKELVKLSISLE